MRRATLLAAFLFAACAPPARRVALEPAPVRGEAAAVANTNLVLLVFETVPNAADEGASFTKIFVNGKEAGGTEVGRKSDPRRLALKLPVGNQPIRLEHWVLTPAGDWKRLDDVLQPRERFVRIEEGAVAELTLRFAENESSNTLAVSREPAPR